VGEGFIRSVVLKRDEVPGLQEYPFSIPALRGLRKLDLHPQVTLLAGENGSGKSTLVEAIAVAAGFNAEGGSRNMQFRTRTSHSELHEHLRLVRGTRTPKTGYFLRAESFFNVATSSHTANRSCRSSRTASALTASTSSTNLRPRCRCGATSR
jgi:predicted ATPase